MTAGEPNGNARWQTFAAVAGVALLLLGGLLTMFGQLTALSSEVAAMQRSLETHEKQLDRVPDLRERLAHLDSDLIEVETQFCGADAIRNLGHASDLRLLAMLWRKTFDMELPTSNAFYPQIGRCAGRTESR